MNTPAGGGGRYQVLGCRHRRGFVHTCTGRGGCGRRILASRHAGLTASGVGRGRGIDRRASRG
ncbi:hypothetical protein, partial [Mycobacterium kyorinense]|uniref:hypothetical protein n=1 Tax=Mycobacterium kyorinense TaxID=487514 RepID=UPI001B80E427